MMCIHIHFQEKKYFRKKTAEITRFDGIALHQWKALFKAYQRLAENFKFIRGLVHNLHKTGRRTLVL